MVITEIRIKPIDSQNGKFKAWASIVLDGQFVIHNLKVIDGSKGLFVAMPNRRLMNGQYKDIVHPLNNETRKYIESTVLAEFKKTIEQVNRQNSN
ncbi:MAG TPA: septation regulator SpoVG [bacterium]|nr:septation regulator SpoVG [bacterium]